MDVRRTRKLKTPSTTRWSELASTNRDFLELYPAVIKSLQLIAESDSFDGSTKAEAARHRSYILKFDFVLTSIVSYQKPTLSEGYTI